MIDTGNRQSRGLLAVNLALAANALLAVAKTAVGIVGHSPGLLADGINSTSDVAFGVVVRIFMTLAGKPPDPEHPYGHSQLESIASLVIGAFVMTTAIAIFWNSVDTVFDLCAGAPGTPASVLALWIALGTVALKGGLALWTRRVGRETGNTAVKALASDHRNDIFTAAAVSAGIIASRAGYIWVDPLAGAAVSVIILWTGIQILRESSDDLMDTVPGHELEDEIRLLVLKVDGVRAAEDIHAHRFGPYMMVNLTVVVDGTLTVDAGDAIATRVERRLKDGIGFIRRVYVHYHGVRNRDGDGRRKGGA